MSGSHSDEHDDYVQEVGKFSKIKIFELFSGFSDVRISLKPMFQPVLQLVPLRLWQIVFCRSFNNYQESPRNNSKF